jgi:hypothetical protein
MYYVTAAHLLCEMQFSTLGSMFAIMQRLTMTQKGKIAAWDSCSLGNSRIVVGKYTIEYRAK